MGKFEDMKNGITYNGEYKNGKIEGRGKLIYKDVYEYDGEFIDGNKNGFGTQIYKKDKTKSIKKKSRI